MIKKVVGKVVIRLSLTIVLIAMLSLVALVTIKSTLGQITEDKINTKAVENKFEINEWSHWLIYYDEVLTQSARNYAYTTDKMWKHRYYTILNDLNKLIKIILSKSQNSDLNLFKEFEIANLKLAKLEEQSFSLVSKGENNEAIELLNSKEYSKYKDIYNSLIKKHLMVKTLNYKNSFLKFKKDAVINIKLTNKIITFLSNLFFVVIILFLLLSFLIIWFVIKRIKKITTFVDHLIVGSDFSNYKSSDKNELDAYVSSLIQTIKTTRLSTDKKFNEELSINIQTLRNEFKRNLHDRLGVLVSATKLHFYFLRPENDKVEVLKHYTTCLKLIDQTFNEIKLLSNSDSSNSYNSKLIDGLRGIISFFKSLQQIDIQLDFRLDEAVLNSEEKECIELILREALNNAVNHAKATKITIQITQVGDIIQITISDNGIGFELEKINRKNGLSHMAKRADSISGNFEIISQIGSGTEIKITFKLNGNVKKN